MTMQPDPDFWPRLVLAILATWRVTHLLVHEDGPFDLVSRARIALGSGAWGRIVGCFHCLGLVVAAPVSLWFGGGAVDGVLTWLALAGGASLCERVGQPVVVVQTRPGTEEARGERDELLRATS
jgi:hypothetical protein